MEGCDYLGWRKGSGLFCDAGRGAGGYLGRSRLEMVVVEAECRRGQWGLYCTGHSVLRKVGKALSEQALGDPSGKRLCHLSW